MATERIKTALKLTVGHWNTRTFLSELNMVTTISNTLFQECKQLKLNSKAREQSLSAPTERTLLLWGNSLKFFSSNSCCGISSGFLLYSNIPEGWMQCAPHNSHSLFHWPNFILSQNPTETGMLLSHWGSLLKKVTMLIPHSDIQCGSQQKESQPMLPSPA